MEQEECRQEPYGSLRGTGGAFNGFKFEFKRVKKIGEEQRYSNFARKRSLMIEQDEQEILHSDDSRLSQYKDRLNTASVETF